MLQFNYAFSEELYILVIQKCFLSTNDVIVTVKMHPSLLWFEIGKSVKSEGTKSGQYVL